MIGKTMETGRDTMRLSQGRWVWKKKRNWLESVNLGVYEPDFDSPGNSIIEDLVCKHLEMEVVITKNPYNFMKNKSY